MKYLPACDLTPDCPGGMVVYHSLPNGHILTQWRKCSECDQSDKLIHRLNGYGRIISPALPVSGIHGVSPTNKAAKI